MYGAKEKVQAAQIMTAEAEKELIEEIVRDISAAAEHALPRRELVHHVAWLHGKSLNDILGNTQAGIYMELMSDLRIKSSEAVDSFLTQLWVQLATRLHGSNFLLALGRDPFLERSVEFKEDGLEFDFHTVVRINGDSLLCGL